MTDFDADKFIRLGYGNPDPIVQAWMVGITGGIVVAVLVSLVAYLDYQMVPQLPLTTTPTGVYDTQPVAPPAPRAEATKQ